MPSLISEYATPGPAVGSVSFDFVQIAWHGFGQARRLSSPIGQISRCFPDSPELDWPAWHRNRICKDAFDWQTKGSAGDRRGLNLAWRPGVNGLAMQSQMAKRPRHQRQSFNCLRLLCQSLCHTIVNKIYSVLVGSFTPWLPRTSQGILIRGVEAVRILLSTIGA